MASRGFLQKLYRAMLTMFIMVVMVGSLIFYSAPLALCILDIVLPCTLLATLRNYFCHDQFKLDWTSYDFGTSPADIPLISTLRSLFIVCVYSVFDAPGLSFGPYLWTTVVCGTVSSLIISLKACLFIASSALESPSTDCKVFYLKQSWGMHVMLLLSVVLGLSHILVAYRTRCKVWRKMLLFHRLDPEAALVCKAIMHDYQRVPWIKFAKGNFGEKCYFYGKEQSVLRNTS